ncbi:MAG: hypothetical protein ABMA26_13460 [Limisphaerales bacterium]
MPTSGLIITLQPDAVTQAGVVARLAMRTELTLGAVSDRWLPAALETRDDAESREVHDWLLALPGVAFVDVVSVNFERGDERSDGAMECWGDEPSPTLPIPSLHHSTTPSPRYLPSP